MGSAASRNGMLLFDNVDPEGEYAAELGPPYEAQAGPVAAAVALGPVRAGFVPAQADGANEQGPEDVPEDESDDEEALNEYLEDLHEHVQDIRLPGQETLVINTSQTRIMPDQAEASEEVHSGITPDQSSDMLQLLNDSGKKYTPTFSTPPLTAITVTLTGGRLVAPALEAIPETARRLEKAPVESVEERALKGQAGEKDRPGAARINQAGPGPGPSTSRY